LAEIPYHELKPCCIKTIQDFERSRRQAEARIAAFLEMLSDEQLQECIDCTKWSIAGNEWMSNTPDSCPDLGN
jgi:hypothetical protein